MSEMTVKTFMEALSEKRLMGAKCVKCNCLFIPPRPLCRECGSRDLDWMEFKGTGVIEALTEITVPLTRFMDDCPYTVVIVQLDEGPSISGLLVHGEKLRVGNRVEATYIDKNGETILGFKSV